MFDYSVDLDIHLLVLKNSMTCRTQKDPSISLETADPKC